MQVDPANAGSIVAADLQTASQSIAELVAKLPASPPANATMPAMRTDLASLGAAIPVAPPMQSVASTSDHATAPLEAIAHADTAWTDEIESLTNDLVPERSEPRVTDSAGDRLAATRTSAPDPHAAEPTREASTAPRAHDTDRAAEILKQIRLRLSPEMRHATIHLAPPELGRLSIHLTLEDRRLSAAVRTEKRETLEVLGRHLPELRAALASHGIEAEQFELALGFQDDANAQSNARERERSSDAVSLPESQPVRIESLTRALASTSGVDLYA